MAKYVFVYHGGSKPDNDEEMASVMQAWGAWFAHMGAAVIDGGAPVGPSSTVHSDGSVTADGGSNPASGYSLVDAADDAAAIAMAKGCPILKRGGSVEVAVAIDM